MVNDSSMGRVGQSVRDIKEYAALRVEGFRLSLIENLATLFNSLFGIFVLSVLVGIAIIFFAIALTWLLGLALGSVLLAVILIFFISINVEFNFTLSPPVPLQS